jgi:3-phosphoshikimate 1-carboxyvinyltransferase
MVAALKQLGLEIEHDTAASTIRLVGCDGRIPASHAKIFVGNSGTTVRFLTAMLTLGQGTFRLDGTPRMHKRPIGDLLDALEQLGGQVTSEAGTGCPPVVVRAAGLSGGRASVAGDISSQYLSGLLMTSPMAEKPVELKIRGPLVSKPYVEMTLAVMAAFGVSVEVEGLSLFSIPGGQRYRGRQYQIEPDASAASYFFAAAAVTGGEVTVEGLSEASIQGDVAFCDCLRRMGCNVQYEAESITVEGRPLRGIEADMNAISDTVPTLAAVALFADGPTTISGVAHIRHKETDRIAAVATELRKLGATVEEREDGMRIVPGPKHGAEIDTYDDHRMAMSFAVAGLATPGVVIRNPDCTAKTYPEFFDDLASLGVRLV